MDSFRDRNAAYPSALSDAVKRILSEYKTADDQADILYRAAQVFQSRGIDDPAECIKFVQQALDVPQVPDVKMQLHIIWADAIIVGNRLASGRELIKLRKEAARQYLLAARVAIEAKLPDVAPPRPDSPPLDDVSTVQIVSSDPQVKAWIQENEKLSAESDKLRHDEDQKAEAELQHVILQEKMVIERESALERVTDLYSKLPFEDAELRSLADEVLHDDVMSSRLMRMVAAKEKQRVQSLKSSVDSISSQELIGIDGPHLTAMKTTSP